MPPTEHTYTHTQAPPGSRRPCPAPSSSLRTSSRSSTPSSRPWPATRCALIYYGPSNLLPSPLHAHIYGLTTIQFIPPLLLLSPLHAHLYGLTTIPFTHTHPHKTHTTQTVFLRDLFAGEGKVVLTPEDCQVPHPICDLSLEAYPDAPICPPTSYKASFFYVFLSFPLLTGLRVVYPFVFFVRHGTPGLTLT